MLRMAKYNVIVKKLSSVETLGGTNVICTDKTGTLTQNKIEVSTIITANEDIMLRVAVLCNTASINAEGKEIGDPLETGLLKFAVKKGINLDEWKKNYPVTHEEPFSSETKIMATQCKTEKGFSVYAKGAVEELIKRCSYVLEKEKEVELNEINKKEWLDKLEQMASSGLRVIGGAYKNSTENEKELSQKLVFAGLFGMIDPPREEVFAAIKECKSAGISVKMITGDHPSTAKNIAIQLGIISKEDDNVMIGKDMNDFSSLSEEEKNKWTNTSVFARVSPKQKLDLVCILQEKKFIVGMTGDGINDAPALKKADIGIAMGQRGTQVAQEVSAMILKDDSFSSIVLAVKQGRIIFENIRKFVIYLLSCNLSELIIISFSSVMNLHYALFPLQILYINLITDVLPALALGVTEGSDSIMKLPPNKSNEPIVDKKRWKSIIVYSVVIACCSLGAVLATHFTIHKTEKWNSELCNNILFMTLILCQLWHVFNMTTDNSVPFYKSDVFRNKYVWYATAICLILTISAYLIPPVAKVLSLYKPSGYDFAVMLGFSLLSMVLIQILKRTKFII
jgi:Ca2+-transporting ATPase